MNPKNHINSKKKCNKKKESQLIERHGEEQPPSLEIVSADEQNKQIATPSEIAPNVGKVITGIEVGSQLIASGIEKGGELGKKAFQRGSELIVARLKPNETPTKVNAALKATVYIAKPVASVAVKLSGTLVKGLRLIAQRIGTIVATEIQKYGEDSGRFKNVKELGKASIFAISTIWTSLEEAGGKLLDGVTHATKDVVQHKWGPDAGEFVQDLGDVTKDVFKSYHNVRSIGIIPFAKNAGQQTAADLVKPVPEQKQLMYEVEEIDEEPRQIGDMVEGNILALPSSVVENSQGVNSDNK